MRRLPVLTLVFSLVLSACLSPSGDATPAQGARDKVSRMLHERFSQFEWYKP